MTTTPNDDSEFAAEVCESVQRAFEKGRETGARLFVAVSGGADSVSLLAALAERFHAQLQCVHVNHNLRGEESREDAAFVEQLCARLTVPCVTITLAEGEIATEAREKRCGLEAAARRLRYRALVKVAKQECADADGGTAAAFIATAHTKNDCLETILMRLLRAAGPRGLAPMKKIRRIGKNPPVFLVRPLLCRSRAEIVAYLATRGLDYRSDSSNADEHFFRNRVRRRLVPLLDEYFPHWERALLRMSETQAEVAAVAARELRAREPRFDGDAYIMEDFWRLPLFLREEALFRAVTVCCRAAERRENAFFPDPPRSEEPPRRSTVRAFCRGGVNEMNLGAASVRRGEDAGVKVTANKNAASSEGSFTIERVRDWSGIRNANKSGKPDGRT